LIARCKAEFSAIAGCKNVSTMMIHPDLAGADPGVQRVPWNPPSVDRPYTL